MKKTLEISILFLFIALLSCCLYLYISISNTPNYNLPLTEKQDTISSTIQNTTQDINHPVIKNDPLPENNESNTILSPTSDEIIKNNKPKKEVKKSFQAIKTNYKNTEITAFTINLNQKSFEFFSYDERNKKNIQTIADLKNYVKTKYQKEVLFATNGGLFHANMKPVGLYIENGIKKLLLNTSDGKGNFFLKPNGIFCVLKSSYNQYTAQIIETKEFTHLTKNGNIQHAIQSGPLLLRNGNIHPKFNINSKNQRVRSGVGIVKGQNTVVFAISNQPITFYDFAQFFKTQYQCADVLYLDGVISKMYLDTPALKNTTNMEGKFGTLIGVLK